LCLDGRRVDLWLYGFLKVHSVLFVNLVPVHEVVLFMLGGSTFSGEMSHSSAVEAGSLRSGRGCLGLSDISSEGSPIEPVRWGSSAS